MNSLVCVDASLIVRTVVPGPFSDEAEGLLAAWRREQRTLIAPSLLAFEVTSVLRRLAYLRAITPARGDEAFAQFLRIPIRLSTRRSIYPLAFRLAKEFNHPRAYDTAYIALAT
jgi:predicted nucleic acid-binding protein